MPPRRGKKAAPKAAPKTKAPAKGKGQSKRSAEADDEPSSNASSNASSKPNPKRSKQAAPKSNKSTKPTKQAHKPKTPLTVDQIHDKLGDDDNSEELMAELSLSNYLENELYPKVKSKKSLDEKTLKVISAILGYTLANAPSPPQLLSFLDSSAPASLVSDIVLSVIPSPPLLSHLLRTSYTADEHNVPVRAALAETFDAVLSHIAPSILEYFLAKGLVPEPKPANKLSSAFHSSVSSFVSSGCVDASFISLFSTLQTTPSFSSISKAYCTALNITVKVQSLEPLPGAYDVYTLQRIGFKYYPEKLTRLGLMGRVTGLEKELNLLDVEELSGLGSRLRLISPEATFEKEELLKIFMHTFDSSAKPPARSIYPTVGDLSGDPTLPYLPTQYVDLKHYIDVNYKAYEQEYWYDLKSDMANHVQRTQPRAVNAADGMSDEVEAKVEFGGWSRYVTPSKDFKITKVGRPRLGRVEPDTVEATIAVDLAQYNFQMRAEWDDGWHDGYVYLINVSASKVADPEKVVKDPTIKDIGVERVRGAKVIGVTDVDGNPVGNRWDDEKQKKQPVSSVRYVRLELSAAQFHLDTIKNSLFIYKEFNLLMRRDGVNNNHPSILATLNQITSEVEEGNLLPPWLHDVFLGYGNVDDASYTGAKMKRYAEITPGVTKPSDFIDFGTAFKSLEHLKASFSGLKVSATGSGAGYSLRVNDGKKTVEAKLYETKETPAVPEFTPVQISAIRSGLNPGLTMVVGPPGTGKTDTAVSIITNLFRSFPSQRTLLVTHSNAALNDLFEKIMATRVVDERYMIRLGSGEKDLNIESTHDFTKQGRVRYTLEKREKSLMEVQSLSESLGVSNVLERGPGGLSSYTCETAMLFYTHHIQARIQMFHSKLKGKEGTAASLFPFGAFFNGEAVKTVDDAKALFEKLTAIFDELEDFRAFELLRSMGKRTDYLMTKQAKIVACTVTHAALARQRLVELGFTYDSIVVEEAGQMLEVENFVPLLLQKNAGGGNRLKRVCLFGDHHQLPPIIKNRDLSTKANMDMSFFTRMIRLGIKHYTLDSQGRAREEMSKLYGWRYGGLSSLNCVKEGRYLKANAGLVHDFQIVDVEDYEGRGEHAPTPHYIQNLGEAEYVVAMFQYMVLIGYDPKRISILTTYNGQKDLIRDVLQSRCRNRIFGELPSVSTVDKYQGQQNDFVLLSLVRTKHIGHLRDVRRLVVALSRAKLGLYVFCRKANFERCSDLKESLDVLGSKGDGKLELVMGEGYGAVERASGEEVEEGKKYVCEKLEDLGKVVHSLQAQVLQQQS
ncbi:hypothetical protein TrVE_jg11448 [Triparma verrucosa]|uniref:P-loop containing nucleoside triphosphate hydrolase protein n=1 Tax=Triparma verrucosa TaxID=1606542 RepID=A0A9W7C649_9STRA|nr:hypothetical protein TrVE_jg11448 [Triparma verrucosa]